MARVSPHVAGGGNQWPTLTGLSEDGDEALKGRTDMLNHRALLLLIAAISVMALALAACGGGEEPTSTPTATATPLPVGEAAEGRTLFIARGCAGCHGVNAEGSAIAPALAGHSEAAVTRQVRTPRFQMPAFSEAQISDEELGEIAHYIAGLEGEGHLHAEGLELTARVEMHHWMALEAVKAGERTDAIHHVGHIIELLEEGEHRQRMEDILGSLEAGEIHDLEHEIEGMLAGTASPDLTLADLHLRQALAALVTEDVADVAHHVAHFQDLGGPEEAGAAAEILDLLNEGNLHDAEDEIRELLGEEAHS